MKIPEILSSSPRPRISLEVFPPKTSSRQGPGFQQHLSRIFDTVEALSKHDPAFISVTYNPEHLTRTTSIPLAAIIKERFSIETMAHITCINTPPRDLHRTLDVLEFFDIDNLMALRGDLTPGKTPIPDCYPHARDLVSQIHSEGRRFSIGVASYPEGHPECVDAHGNRDMERDLRNLIDKVRKGADFTVTQLFLDNTPFFHLVEKLRSEEIEIPIIPGIMPITNRGNIKVIKSLTGIHLPDHLAHAFEQHWDEKGELFEIGVEHAIGQCKGLVDRVPCIHFYTMDTWEATDRIIQSIR